MHLKKLGEPLRKLWPHEPVGVFSDTPRIRTNFQDFHNMNRVSVTSSNIASIGYAPDSKILEVEFVNGTVYQYFDVAESLYLGLMSASSHGRYLAMHIKDHNYRFVRIK
jgi:hypothetical protein